MICVSICERTTEECLHALEGIHFAEIRMERLRSTPEEIHSLFSSHPRLIATCKPGMVADPKRRNLLLEAMRGGAAYVDIELEADAQLKKDVVLRARSLGCQVIVSHHDFHRTPEREELEHTVDRCFESGADICKIACWIHSGRDNARLLGLLQQTRPMVVIGMGKKGKITRILAPLLGSPFTYASLAPGKETAEGQMDRMALEKWIQSLRDA